MSLNTMYQWARTLPGVRSLLQWSYGRRFARQGNDFNGYWGIFPTFASAVAHAPTTRPVGYDNAEGAALYAARTRYVLACDYPAIFWLERLLREGARSVFDLGGHIGIKYYAFQRYLEYPSDLRWTVCELPTIAAAGAAWARDHDAGNRIGFTPNGDDASGQDVLFASGSLQYLDYTLAGLLDRLDEPPRHVLINVLPLHPQKSFFTVQNMGTHYCAYRVQAMGEFIDGLKQRGYEMRDHWDQLDRSCDIPFYPDCKVEKYRGFVFSRTGARATDEKAFPG